MNSWAEVLQAEGLPENCSLVFHCHNGGIRRIVRDGVQVQFSPRSREFARRWIFSNRVESFIVDTSRLDGYDWKRVACVDVSFHGGEPNGHPAFGNRKEHKAALSQIWGKTKYWEAHR